MAGLLHVRIDPAALAAELRGPNGSVVRHLAKVATAVQQGARAIEEPHIKTGQLHAKILKRPGSGAGGHFWNVVSAAPYGYFVHEPGVTRDWAGRPCLTMSAGSLGLLVTKGR